VLRHDATRSTWTSSWLKDESLEDSANLPAPDIIVAEIVEDLQAALEQFSEIAADLPTDESESKTR
jgi:type I restriction enzyme M protein